MSSTPFRFVQRRTTVSGRVPATSGLLTGEIYLQLADGTIYFKDAYRDRLYTVITDASGFGLNKLKFSGANSGDFPIWDGNKIIPYNTGNLVSNLNIDTSSFVLTGQTGSFITTGQTGSFGGTVVYQSGSGSSSSILNTGYGLNSIQQTGSNNYSSGDYSLTIGSGNSAAQDFSYAFGNQAKTSQFGEFAFSNGSFSENGDSQYSFVMGRAATNDSTPTKISINNSDKIIEINLGTTVFFTANVVGAGTEKYYSTEIRGIIKRSVAQGSQVSFLNSPTKNIFALSPSNANFSVNASVSTSDNSLKIECVGDSSEEMIWFAKIDLIIVKQPILNLNNLTVEEIAALPLNIISSLTIFQISSLTAASINALTPTQLNALSAEQLAAFTNYQLQTLFESNIIGYETPTDQSNQNEFASSLIVSSSEIVDLINTTLNNGSQQYLEMDSGEDI